MFRSSKNNKNIKIVCLKCKRSFIGQKKGEVEIKFNIHNCVPRRKATVRVFQLMELRLIEKNQKVIWKSL